MTTPHAHAHDATPTPPQPNHGADPGDAGRAGHGRFAPGNTAGKGNPLHRKMAELNRRVVQSQTPEDVAGVLTMLYTKAQEGNLAATRVLLKYTLGRPRTRAATAVDAPDGPKRLDPARAEALVLETL